MMDPAERFNLSLISKRIEVDVHCARTRLYSPIIVFVDSYSKIFLKEIKGFELTCTITGFRIKTGKHFSKIGSIIENTSEAINRLRNTSKCGKIDIRIRTKSIEKSFIEEILSNTVLENYSNISMIGVAFDMEAMTFFMNTAKFDSRFSFRNSEMPLDLRHENALKFKRSIYDDARWVRVDDLLRIVNVDRMILYRTNLTSDDVRTLLTHWINSDVDMFQSMRIVAKEDIELDELFDSLVVLKHLHDSFSTIFTLAKSPSRVFPVLAITHRLPLAIMSAWKPDETFNDDPSKDEYKPTYQILQLLERKTTLERTLEQRNNVDQIQMTEELAEIMQELWRFGVFFEGGRATRG
ncbi:hypothetical protein CRE_03981 [Caenorhabditis remanei]|uniref:F-box associated domain-containing protein n=1 Tax=Caenorhabditis remanei TaxID=31234 RepID=E3LY61_CAERE|nr:hypothetical protein CRE_03981 [Caenorhabditis remanei]